MDFKAKSKLSKEMANTLRQLPSLHFRGIGDLYLSTVGNHVSNRMLSTEQIIDQVEDIQSHARRSIKTPRKPACRKENMLRGPPHETDDISPMESTLITEAI